MAANRGGVQAPASPAKTYTFRKWKGVNLTDARTALDPDELSWSENALTVGNGAIQLTNAKGATLATIAAGVTSLWGFTLTIAAVATPILIVVSPTGAMTQVNVTTGAQTAVAGAGTVSTSAHVAIWRDSPILIIDPTFGYFSWDGAALTVIDATKTGATLAVFQSRVWQVLPTSRTVRYTSPNTYNDFTGANGAGSFVVTDEAFPGTIIGILSVVEQLWILGTSAIEAVANVSTTGGTTTFSITNIVTGLGTNAPNSTIGYFRALAFMAPFGVYALSGVTPQKLSAKLDGMFPALTLTPDVPAAIASVQNILVLCFLVTYTQSLAPSLPKPANGSSGATTLLLCFAEGKWFFASQGALTWITTVIVSGTTKCYGTDGSTVYPVFGAASTTGVPYKVQLRQDDYGDPTATSQMLRIGLETQAANPITPTVTVDSEITGQTAALTFTNTLTWVNSSGGVITFVGAAPITWISQGLILAKVLATMFGHYMGVTISGTDPPYRIQAVETEVVTGKSWT